MTYIIEKPGGEETTGIPSDILSKGNTDDYPTFELADGSIYSCHRDRVRRVEELT